MVSNKHSLLKRVVPWNNKRKTESRLRQGLRVCELVAQSCPTPRNPMDCSQPGSSVHGILQARILVWLAVSFSRGSS